MSASDIGDLTQALLKFLCYLQRIFVDTYVYAKFALKNLCIAWYPLAILTLIPVFKVEIPDYSSVLYLLAYCLISAWVCASEPTSPKKSGKSQETGFMRNVRIDGQPQT